MNTPETHPQQRPLFMSATECNAWLATLPASQPAQAQAQCIRQLNLLNRQAMDANERLAILETLRSMVLQLQIEAARRFAHRPLPLSATEREAFDASRSLWLALFSGYLCCLDGTEGDAKPTQRALATLADALLDTYRAGHTPTAEQWRQAHTLYTVAERAGFTAHEVVDPRAGKHATTVRNAYVELLLVQAASPYELPARQLLWASRWARRWSGKVTISAERPGKEGQICPLCLDLGSAEPASFKRCDGVRVRWLDTSELRASLKKRTHLLEQGAAPATLQLGEDCQQPACGLLLRQVYQRWCKGGATRGQERHAVDGRCELVGGMEAVHYYLSGRKPFRQPGHASDDTLRRERDEIATFGRIAPIHEENFTREQGYQIDEWRVVEEWQLKDESAAGIHVTHATSNIAARVGHGQLVGIRLQGSQAMQIGVMRWANIGNDDQIHAGILVTPGRPEPVAIRSTDADTAREPYRQAFLLPAVAALNCAASVILPTGWYKLGRILDIAGGNCRQIRLLQLASHGMDFDQAGYEVLS